MDSCYHQFDLFRIAVDDLEPKVADHLDPKVEAYCCCSFFDYIVPTCYAPPHEFPVIENVYARFMCYHEKTINIIPALLVAPNFCFEYSFQCPPLHCLHGTCALHFDAASFRRRP